MSFNVNNQQYIISVLHVKTLYQYSTHKIEAFFALINAASHKCLSVLTGSQKRTGAQPHKWLTRGLWVVGRQSQPLRSNRRQAKLCL